MPAALAQLLLFQLVGEVLARALALPVPGPVLGMALLFAVVSVRGARPALRDTANGLLAHLSLLFVPAGVGVMVHGARLGAEWLPIAAALLGSTLVGLAVTAWVLQRLVRGRGGGA